MRTLSASRPGGPDQLAELPGPDVPLEPGHVRIATSAIGMNYAELVQIAGEFQLPAPEPIVPGFELTGTVTELGDGTDDLQVGQTVLALVPWGAYADQLVTETVRVLPVLDGMDDLTAATFPVCFATAHVSLLHRGGLRAGETVVVTGVTGNVGEAALQVARAAGATTIAVDRSGSLPHEAADHVIASDGVAAAVRELTDGRGADVALDLVGADLTLELLHGLAWEGRLVTTGFASGVIPDLSLLEVLVANVAVIGEDIAGYAYRDPATVRDALRQCLGWWADGRLDPRTPTPHPFGAASASQALASIADGSARGKQVLSLRSA